MDLSYSENAKIKKKKSRIISIQDSSEEEQTEDTHLEEKQSKKQKKRKVIRVANSSSDDEEKNLSSPAVKDEKLKKSQSRNASEKKSKKKSIISIHDSSVDEDDKMAKQKKPSIVSIHDSSIEENDEVKSEEESPFLNKEDNLKSLEELKTILSKKGSKRNSLSKSLVDEITPVNGKTPTNSTNNLNSAKKRSRKSSLTVKEDVLLDELQTGEISEKLNKVFNIFATEMKEKESSGNVLLNISLNYTPDEESSRKRRSTEPGNALSPKKSPKVPENSPKTPEKVTQKTTAPSEMSTKKQTNETLKKKKQKTSNLTADQILNTESAFSVYQKQKKTKKTVSESPEMNSSVQSASELNLTQPKMNKKKTETVKIGGKRMKLEVEAENSTVLSKKAKKSDVELSLAVAKIPKGDSNLKKLPKSGGGVKKLSLFVPGSMTTAAGSWKSEKVKSKSLKPTKENILLKPDAEENDFRTKMLFNSGRVKRAQAKN